MNSYHYLYSAESVLVGTQLSSCMSGGKELHVLVLLGVHLILVLARVFLVIQH